MARGLEGGVRTATEHDAGDAAGHRPPRDRRVPGEQAERAAIVRELVNVGEGVRFLRTEPPEREESLVQRA